MRVFVLLGSLKLTLVLFLALLAAAIAVSQGASPSGWTIAGPLFGFALNLIGAVISNPVFRRKTALLVFHLCLISLAAVAGVGRMVWLGGNVEVPVGQAFDPALAVVTAGPWHRLALDRVRFTNDGFSVAYAPGVKRAETRNQVTWYDDAGQPHREVIGDIVPLEQAGYRFYTSHNKGFTLLFTWRPLAGSPVTGTVNLPSYPVNEGRQFLEWTVPGTPHRLTTSLELEEEVLDPSRSFVLRAPRLYSVKLQYGDGMQVLRPGEQFELPDGVLELTGLGLWMGYTIYYDWTQPWLFAAAAVGLISLLLNYRSRFMSSSWERVGEARDGN